MLVWWILGAATFSWIGSLMWVERRRSVKELGRFTEEQITTLEDARRQFTQILKDIAEKGGGKETETGKKLVEAGLESAKDRGKFLLLKAVSMTLLPLGGASTYLVLPPYYATISLIFSVGFGLVLPALWLKTRTTSRLEEIQRELPLVLDLTNLGTSAGWDVASSLERVIDVLVLEFPDHPLMRELQRARIVTSNGYTWHEALDGISERLNDEAVRRSCLALSQAIRQGGDRSSHLEGIADDAQRTYYSVLDRRLAALPVKALVLTMLLMISYFLLLLAPAAVQVKVAVGG